MRTLILLILISVISSTVWGNGGVDVGNGSQKGFVTGIVLPDFEQEKEFLNFVKEILPQVRNGSHQKLKEFIEQGNCDADKISVKDVESLKIYNFIGEKAAARQTGYLSIELKNCQTPELIKTDKRPKNGRKTLSFI
ncbi:MAG: hypothetical protein ACLGHN_05710 [Bacteriovoracia bacterium]